MIFTQSDFEARANTILAVYNPHCQFLYLYDSDPCLEVKWEPGEEVRIKELLAACSAVAEKFQKPVIISGRVLDKKDEKPYYVLVKHREGPLGNPVDWNPALFT